MSDLIFFVCQMTGLQVLVLFIGGLAAALLVCFVCAIVSVVLGDAKKLLLSPCNSGSVS